MDILGKRASWLGGAAALALALACAPAWATCPRNAYAFTKAHVITVSGPAIDGGTVVVCDGVITAVGADAAIPPEAEVIDAAGLTLYPGFFDGYSQYGLPAAPAAAGRGGGRGSGQQAEAAQNALIAATLDGIAINDQRRYIDPEPAGVESQRLTAELLAPEASLGATRDKGILAALVIPADGIFKGEAALVNLAGPDAAAMLIQPRAGQVMQLAPSRGGGGGGGGSGYPASVMGAVAIYRQTLLDAQRLQTCIDIYKAAGMKGMPPPPYDPKTMALLPLLGHADAAYFVAPDQDSIERALRAAAEFNLANPVIVGGNDAQKAIPALQAAHASVLLSLTFAAAGGGGGGFGGGGRGGAAASPEVARAERELAESNPANLVKAGIPVGFTSDGLAANQDLVAQVKIAMTRGLSEADAWKGLTLWPARIVGADAQLGSVEVGKIANLVLATGDPLGAGPAVNKWIVVDGRLLAVHPPAAAAPAGRGGRGGRDGEGQQ